ncbi:MAG: AEC family transporter [Fibrobacterota bacterium]
MIYENLIFSIGKVLPVFLVIFAGALLKKLGVIDRKFASDSTKLVFKFALPCLIFQEISSSDFIGLFDPLLIGISYAGTLAVFGLSWLISLFITSRPETRGAFIQGSYRSNFAIIGFPIIFNIFGQEGMPAAIILLTFAMPLFNILAVIALTLNKTGENRNVRAADTLKEIAKNPLIISVLVSLPFSFLRIEIPGIINNTLDYFVKLTLPLALCAIGATLEIRKIRESSTAAFSASSIKLIVSPGLVISAALLLDIDNIDAGVLFILFGAPAAISSFVMAEAMGSDSGAAANIVMTTTLLSIITISAGITILKTIAII